MVHFLRLADDGPDDGCTHLPFTTCANPELREAIANGTLSELQTFLIGLNGLHEYGSLTLPASGDLPEITVKVNYRRVGDYGIPESGTTISTWCFWEEETGEFLIMDWAYHNILGGA
jgi:hypothetical protein